MAKKSKAEPKAEAKTTAKRKPATSQSRGTTPAAKAEEPKRAAPASKGSAGKKLAAVIFALVIIFAIAGVLVYGINTSAPANFSTFQKNFDSAPRVGIIVTEYNETALAATVGCATALIEQIVGNQQSHRNASTIDFYVLNATTCTYSASGIGGEISNYSYTSKANCIATGESEPSIFINYSNTNSTLIYPTTLYVSGDARFLGQCGIASEISANPK